MHFFIPKKWVSVNFNPVIQEHQNTQDMSLEAICFHLSFYFSPKQPANIYYVQTSHHTLIEHSELEGIHKDQSPILSHTGPPKNQTVCPECCSNGS